MSETDIKNIRNYLKNNILNNNTFIGHENERKEIFDLIQKTVQYGESNSALLIGPRGSGKTIVILIYLYIAVFIIFTIF